MRTCLAGVCLLAVLGEAGGVASAQDVFVRAGASGRGLLVARGGECFVLTPAHVVEGEAPVRVIGNRAVQADVRRERQYPPDLALLRVTDGSDLCQDAQPLPAAVLDDLLNDSVNGVLRSRTEGGGREQVPVYLRHYDDQYVTIVPQNEADQLAQSYSGSVLIVGGQPVGILLTVSAQSGQGRLYRFDRVAERLASFFGSQPQAAGAPDSQDFSRGTVAAAGPEPFELPIGPNSCEWANDGECDEPDLCAPNTDTNDCRLAPETDISGQWQFVMSTNLFGVNVPTGSGFFVFERSSPGVYGYTQYTQVGALESSGVATIVDDSVALRGTHSILGDYFVRLDVVTLGSMQGVLILADGSEVPIELGR